MRSSMVSKNVKLQMIFTDIRKVPTYTGLDSMLILLSGVFLERSISTCKEFRLLKNKKIKGIAHVNPSLIWIAF